MVSLISSFLSDFHFFCSCCATFFLLLMLLFGRLSCLSIFLFYFLKVYIAMNFPLKTNLAESSKLYRLCFHFHLSEVFQFFFDLTVDTSILSRSMFSLYMFVLFQFVSSIDVTGRKMLNISFIPLYLLRFIS